MATDRTTLKGYFETGDFPTQAQFAALIDGAVNVDAAVVASTTGNARGAGAVDLQLTRAEVTQVASEHCATVGGGWA